MNHEVGTPPAYPTTASSRSRAWLAVLALAALLAGLLALSPLAPASAYSPSEWCYDDIGHPSVPLVTGQLGLPLWLGVESGAFDGNPGHVTLCYGTGAPGDAKTIGGGLFLDFFPNANNVYVHTGNSADDNGALRNSFDASTQPQWTINPGGTNGGQEISFGIPLNFCAGVCYPGPGLNTLEKTGVILGTISQTPTGSGGTSASYNVTGLCIKVDGQTVAGSCESGIGDAGVTTTGYNPVALGTGQLGCVLGSICLPGSLTWLGITDATVATAYIPVVGSIPINTPRQCVWQTGSYCG